jgi:hypothetical protein
MVSSIKGGIDDWGKAGGSFKIFLCNIDRLITGGARENIALQPMMEGYDGGVYRVYVALLDENGGILYQNEGENIGQLKPEPGTGSWHAMPSYPPRTNPLDKKPDCLIYKRQLLG